MRIKRKVTRESIKRKSEMRMKEDNVKFFSEEEGERQSERGGRRKGRDGRDRRSGR